MTVMDELNADITLLKRCLAEARDQLSRSGPDERTGFLARFKAAKALLGSDDLQELRDSRIRLSQEFHRLIAGIVLHPTKQRSADRRVTVHLKPDADGIKTSYVLSPQTLVGIHFACRMVRPVSSALPSCIRSRRTFGFHTGPTISAKSELVRRSLINRSSFEIRDGYGNYRAVPL